MNNLNMKPMELSILNCAGLEGSDLAENTALVRALGADRMVWKAEMKASAELIHLETSHIKVHDEWLHWTKRR